MLRVKDSNGMIIQGLFKSTEGVLIVSDPDKYNKYKNDLAQRDKVSALELKIQELTDIINRLVDKDGQ